ncbi:hypothetical protein GMDG_07480 [Pseudogymnoascus destructans 20631-21]|uniref:alpha-1,2-Mannosidase n=1 Tax=Pseudogymnoascus destructans (strain ATCC MYA-4855 / 20631-21) TaxID=658429 RepID=L8FX62_PSED2|nr:hypothetical protein GMDG_07480 [Pseudogymnoascus destructans 20631-21]
MLISILHLASGLSLATVALAAPQSCVPKQDDSATRAAAVKEAFEFAWEGYYKYAFPHDELRPVTNGFTNSRNGWGASAADALSTALVMEIPEIVNQIVDYIPTVDFTKTNDQVSLFETTIRYLGGMISGYDLLKGPLASLIPDNKNIESLLAQSKNLADQMKFAFDTPSGVPANNLNLEAQATDGGDTNGIATIGTLVLEWTRLSDLTGDDEYAKLSQKGESHLLAPKPENNVPFPGLIGTNVNLTTGEFYLIKMYIYDPSRFKTYKDRWILAADSTIKHLTSHPKPRPDLTFVANYDGANLQENSGHLTCFDGGNFLLGGSVLKRKDYIDFGLSLVDGCRATYTATKTHIGPEGFSWDASKVPTNQADFFKKNGFYITSPDYVLRPEVIESYYYAYRITRDQKYQEWAWDAFVAINATTRVGSGFSSISDVNAEGGGQKTNFQESFLFAEVLKYTYLIHAKDNVWQVDGKGNNAFVFNTEAHPFQIYKGASK